MMISFVIPMYNGEKTIAKTLESLKSVDYDDFEVIVVDDCSTDSSVEIVKKFNCQLVRADKKLGAALARNVGVENSKGDLIFFIDADILVYPDCAKRVAKTFEENQDVVAVVGVLSKDNPYSNFSSQYKNFHMHYYMKNMPRYISCVYTSVTAIRRDTFKKVGFFDSKTCRVCNASVEDIDLGQRISDAGFKIMLDPELQVVHMRNFTLRALISNDFRRAIDWSLLFLQKSGLKRSIHDGVFAYLPVSAIIGTIISPFILLSILLFFISMNKLFFGLFIILSMIFIFLNFSFLKFVKQEKGLQFFIKSTIFIYTDNIIAIAGSFIGLLMTIFSRRTTV
jgi:glycosyltransferase involved in cell wall biosynthesis